MKCSSCEKVDDASCSALFLFFETEIVEPLSTNEEVDVVVVDDGREKKFLEDGSDTKLSTTNEIFEPVSTTTEYPSSTFDELQRLAEISTKLT